MTTPQMAEQKNLLLISPKVGASAAFTSIPFAIQQWGRYALQVNIANESSLNCAIVVQSTVDCVNWASVPGSSVTFTSNTSYIWDNYGSGVQQVRLSVTFTGGSADFTMCGFAKI